MNCALRYPLSGIVTLLLLVVACSAPDPRLPEPHWPAEQPDVVVIGFAGRCNMLRGCSAPEGNRAYLSEAPDPNTLGAIQHTLEQLGYSAIAYSFRAHLFDSPAGNGYLRAEALLQRVQEEWIKGAAVPTRVILVAHSHGTQFLSLLAWDHPEITFDYAIYLDAICLGWNSDHDDMLRLAYGNRAQYPAPLDALDSACDSVEVPGRGTEDISDVVPFNVHTGIEVRSRGILVPGLITDDDPNHRPDGTFGPDARLLGIHQTDEGHREVHRDGSAALNWVTDLITANGLPVALTGSSSQTAIPAAPVGYSLDQ